jgi:hypothetical protein
MVSWLTVNQSGFEDFKLSKSAQNSNNAGFHGKILVIKRWIL